MIEQIAIEQIATQFGIAGFSIYIIYKIYKDTIDNQKEAFNNLAKAINGFRDELEKQKEEFSELKKEVGKLCAIVKDKKIIRGDLSWLRRVE
jgi:hypothetical protein